MEGSFFVNGKEWFLTGDSVTIDEDGYLFYGGRADDVINSAGYRIGPLEVENVLMEHPAVQECAVVASPDQDRGPLLHRVLPVSSVRSRLAPWRASRWSRVLHPARLASWDLLPAASSVSTAAKSREKVI